MGGVAWRLGLSVGLVGLVAAGGVPVQRAEAAAPVYVKPVPACVGSSLCGSGNLPILKEIIAGGGKSAPVPVKVATKGGFLPRMGGKVWPTLRAVLGLGSLGGQIWEANQSDLPDQGFDPQADHAYPFDGNIKWTKTGSPTIYKPFTGGINVVAGTNFQGTYVRVEGTRTATENVSGYNFSTGWVLVDAVCGASSVRVASSSGNVGGSVTFAGTVTNCAGGLQRLVLKVWQGEAYLDMPIDIGGGIDWDPTNPRRWVEQTVTCRAKNGSLSNVTATSEIATGATSWGVPEVACPAGTIATRLRTKLRTEGDTPTVDGGDYSLPEGWIEYATGSDPDNPCYLRPGEGNCVVEIVRKDGTLPADDWAVNPEPGGYRCTYGGTDIPLEFCLPYAPVEAPTTGEDEVPAPVSEPDRPGQPVPFDWPPVNPDPNPTPTPTPTPNPSTSGAPSPTPTPNPSTSGGASPTPSPSTSGSTPAGGEEDEETFYQCLDFSLSSLFSGKVVYEATSCALQEAFVPSAAAMNAARARMNTAWSTSTPGVVAGQTVTFIGAIGDLGGSFNSGCSGPSFQLGGKTVFPVSACDAPISGYASASRMLTSAAVTIGGVMVGLRTFFRAFGLEVPWSGGGL